MVPTRAVVERPGLCAPTSLDACSLTRARGLDSWLAISPAVRWESSAPDRWKRFGAFTFLVVARAAAVLGSGDALGLLGLHEVDLANQATYYGWSPAVWRAEVVPFVTELRTELGVPATPSGIQLLG